MLTTCQLDNRLSQLSAFLHPFYVIMTWSCFNYSGLNARLNGIDWLKAQNFTSRTICYRKAKMDNLVK